MAKLKKVFTLVNDLNFEGIALDRAIEKLKEVKKEFSPIYKDLEIQILSDYGDGYKLSLLGSRPETDAEEAQRLKIQKEMEERQELYLKRQYEHLKKRFEEG